MIKLLVIADDFTGALDTGIQFKAKGTLVSEYIPPKTRIFLLGWNRESKCLLLLLRLGICLQQRLERSWQRS